MSARAGEARIATRALASRAAKARIARPRMLAARAAKARIARPRMLAARAAKARIARPRVLAALATCIACAIAAGPASAADPRLWVVTKTRTIPAWYRQGLASDPQLNVYFSGSFAGVYRTRNLVEQARNTTPIPPDVAQREKYNHIGDIAWDAGEGGRLLLPLEGYAPLEPDTNASHTGSIGVMDPKTLMWRYYVKLDPAEIAKTQWVATDAPRGLVWTISGQDLLAYNLSDINPANAAPAGPVIHSVGRIPNVLPNGAGGAVVLGGRIYLSTELPGLNQIISIDPGTGASQLEFERPQQLEPEGMDSGPYLNGLLQWELVPGAGLSNTQLVTLVPHGSPLRLELSKTHIRAGTKTPVTATVTVATNGFRIPLGGARVTIAGHSAKTGDNGRAKLSLELRPGSHRAQASFTGLKTGSKHIRALARPRLAART